MWILPVSLVLLAISFLDYCILRFSGDNDRERSDEMQEEFIKHYQETHHL